MQSFSETYDDLEKAIDDVRQLLDDWLKTSDEAPMSTWITGDRDSNSQGPQHADSQEHEAGDASASEESTAGGSTTESREKSVPYDLVPPHAASSDARPLESPSSDAPSSDAPSSDAPSSDAPGRPSVLRYVQVVLHEWLANMIQHAEFGDATPHIEITVRADRAYVSCSVIDNSHGFDLSDALTTQRNEARALPERGMGLRIISACTEQCAYRSLPDGRYRFEFSIPVDHDPWLSTLF